MVEDTSSKIIGTVFKLARFAVPQLLTAVFSLYAISILSKSFGGKTLLAYGLGQSYGTFVALFMGWGWTTIGPALVAPAEQNKRYSYLWTFLKMTFILGAILTPIVSVLVVWSAPDGDRDVALVSFLASVVTAFMPSWWFVATNRPSYILFYDVLPRALSTLISIILMKHGGSAYLFPLSNMICCILGASIFYWQKKPWNYKGPEKVLDTFKSQFHPFMISAGAMLYARLMLPVVNFINPVAAVSFTQGLQLYNYWTMSTAITGSSFQNWVNRGGKKTLESSLKFTTSWFFLHGIVFGGLLGILGPFVSNVIFGGLQGNTKVSYFLLGLTFFFVAMGTALVTLYLTPLGYSHLSSKITIFSGILGLLLLLVLTTAFGVNGSYVALCITEFNINFLALIVIVLHRKGKLKTSGV
ncbi:MAG: hypothetical protein QM632_00605 [Micrococcaceae bacterium]